jgi:hypothetical protein
MKIVVDCEFAQLNASSKLISMALVAEDGQELYFELNDNYVEADCSDFVIERVLPQLNGSNISISLATAREALLAFLARFDQIDIMSDAPVWDWEFFCDLAYQNGKWPRNVSNRPLSLIDLFNERDVVGEDAPELPHHALLDARLLMDYYKRLLK